MDRRSEGVALVSQVIGIDEALAAVLLDQYSWNTTLAISKYYELDLSPELLEAAAEHVVDDASSPSGSVDNPSITTDLIQQVEAVIPADPELIRSVLMENGGDVDDAIMRINSWLTGHTAARRHPAGPTSSIDDPMGMDSLAAVYDAIEEVEEEEHLAQAPPAKVYCNVYNLAPKHTLEKIGLGLYHTGIEVYNREWCFGGSSDPAHSDLPGVGWCRPGAAEANLIKKIELGVVHKTPKEVIEIIESMKDKWKVGQYHIIQKNCNHFSDAFSAALGTMKLPAWVNRAARVGDTVIPNRIVNYFVSQAAPPPQAMDLEAETKRKEKEKQEKERKRKNKPRLFGKKQAEIVGEHNGAVFRVGDIVRYSAVSGLKKPEDTGHTRAVIGGPPVRGLRVLSAVPDAWNVVRLQYPRQVYLEDGTLTPVVIGPFESTCHVSYLEKDDGPPPPDKISSSSVEGDTKGEGTTPCTSWDSSILGTAAVPLPAVAQ